MAFKFTALPVNDLTDATLNFEQLQRPLGDLAVIKEAPLNVQWPEWGADPTGVTDSAAAINGALRAAVNGEAIVPPGTYRVDTTITIPASTMLTLMAAATLLRPTAAAATTPVVNLTGVQQARLMGHGAIHTQKASPQGIVLVGPPTQTVTTTVGFWRIGPVVLTGQNTPAASDIGLNLWSSQASVGDGGSGSGSNYNGVTEDGLWINNVGEGIRLGSQCNAHNFGAINFSQLAAYSYRLMGGAGGVQECSFAGGFTHSAFSTSNITIIKGERAMFCCFFGVQAEPGNTAIGYSLDANSTQNRIMGFLNTSGTNVDSGTRNIILDQNLMQVCRLDASAAAGSVNIMAKAGVPVDGDFLSPVKPGLLCLDDTNNKLYVRTTAGWKSTTLI